MNDRAIARSLHLLDGQRDRYIAQADRHLATARALDERIFRLLLGWTQ